MILKVIKQGTTSVEADEGRLVDEPGLLALKRGIGAPGGSTVAFIDPGNGEKIIFDTGFDHESNLSLANRTANADMLLALLRLNGVDPDEITSLILSHLHMDHVGNFSLFKKARILLSENIEQRRLDFFEFDNTVMLADGDEIALGVRVLDTPGHTDHHISVSVETGDYTVVLAGDAVVSKSYFDSGKVWRFNSDFHSERAAVGSMKMIAGIADIIVPGHGPLFLA